MYLQQEYDPRNEALEKEITVKINNADFHREVAYQLFDDMYKDEMYKFLIRTYPDNMKQAFIDDQNPKELFVDLLFESIKLRNFYRVELEDLLKQWEDME